jgi:hypothetical protein
MINIFKFIIISLFLLTVILIHGCDYVSIAPWPEGVFDTAAPSKTCSKQIPQGADFWRFVFRHKVERCLLVDEDGLAMIETFYANNREEAVECALKLFVNPEEWDVLNESLLINRYFVIIDYATCDFADPDDDPECIQHQEPTVSPEDAYICVLRKYPDLGPGITDIRIIDVTEEIINEYGGIDYWKWDDCCPEGCFP